MDSANIHFPSQPFNIGANNICLMMSDLQINNDYLCKEQDVPQLCAGEEQTET
jgi:hypothetical protein